VDAQTVLMSRLSVKLFYLLSLFIRYKIVSCWTRSKTVLQRRGHVSNVLVVFSNQPMQSMKCIHLYLAAGSFIWILLDANKGQAKVKRWLNTAYAEKHFISSAEFYSNHSAREQTQLTLDKANTRNYIIISRGSPLKVKIEIEMGRYASIYTVVWLNIKKIFWREI